MALAIVLRNAHLIRDIGGLRFDRLTVERYVPGFGRTESRWRCRCYCGQVAYVLGGQLLAGNVSSCGCKRREVNRCDSPAFLQQRLVNTGRGRHIMIEGPLAHVTSDEWVEFEDLDLALDVQPHAPVVDLELDESSWWAVVPEPETKPSMEDEVADDQACQDATPA